MFWRALRNVLTTHVTSHDFLIGHLWQGRVRETRKGCFFSSKSHHNGYCTHPRNHQLQCTNKTWSSRYRWTTPRPTDEHPTGLHSDKDLSPFLTRTCWVIMMFLEFLRRHVCDLNFTPNLIPPSLIEFSACPSKILTLLWSRSNKPGMRIRTAVFFFALGPQKRHFTLFWPIECSTLNLYYFIVIKIQKYPAICYISWYISRKHDSKKMTSITQSTVYPELCQLSIWA